MIFAPNKSTAHVVGGNVRSEHCGRCTQIKVFEDNGHSHPMGSCRPATALVESHNSISSHRSTGCKQRALERLFVFGGYQPQNKRCTNELYSFKFLSDPCPALDSHRCAFTETPIIKRIDKKLEEQKRQRQQQQEQEQEQEQQ